MNGPEREKTLIVPVGRLQVKFLTVMSYYLRKVSNFVMECCSHISDQLFNKYPLFPKIELGHLIGLEVTGR